MTRCRRRSISLESLKALLHLTNVLITQATLRNFSTPLAKPLSSEFVVPSDGEKLFTPRAGIEINDDGELNWPIYVSDSAFLDTDFEITDVRVTIRGLFHEDARDVRVDLLHGENQVLLVDNDLFLRNERRGRCHFGTPRERYPPPGSFMSGGFPVGVDIYFSDGDSSITQTKNSLLNLAFGKNASQSSTASVTPHTSTAAYDLYDASLAVDGDVEGLVSDVTVAMTADSESYDHGAGDGNPWWEVDLGSDFVLGSIWLWGVDDERVIVRHEIQTVTLNAGLFFETWLDEGYLEQRSQWFTLQFTDRHGDTFETRAISADAPACGGNGCDYEDLNQTSVQFALQELPNLWDVGVSREDIRGVYGDHSSVEHFLGYVWRITFFNPTGNARLIQIGDAYNLTDTDSQAKVSNISNILSVAFDQHGIARRPSRSLVNQYAEDEELSGEDIQRVWVMVFDDDLDQLIDRTTVDSIALVDAAKYASTNDTAFHRARNVALWSEVFEFSTFHGVDNRQIHFQLPDNISARYVRVQAETTGVALTLAEVQVFGSDFKSNDLNACNRGSQIESDEYTPFKSLSAAFNGASCSGEWILRIQDLHATEHDPDALDAWENFGRSHGTGFLHDWILQLQDTSGEWHYFYTDLEFQVVAMPACGRLFTWNSENNTVDEEILAKNGYQRSRDKCDTNFKEHVAADANFFDSRTLLLYIPRDSSYEGDDHFSFRAQIHNTGATSLSAPDANGQDDYKTITLHVRQCRVRHCDVAVETLVCTDDVILDECDVTENLSPGSWIDPGFVSPTFYEDYGAAEHLEDYQSQSQFVDRSIHILEEDDTWYESIGQGHCSDKSVETHGRSEIEFCYYSEGYESEERCAALCTHDEGCAGYTRGKQGKRYSVNFNGWCITYTTSDCAEYGEKANEGVGVHITGSQHNPMYDSCFIKQTGAVEFSRCWNREPGFCDDALTLLSWTYSIEECQNHCAQITALVEPVCSWSSEPNASSYLPGLTDDDGEIYASLSQAKVACEQMYLRGEDMEGCNGITYFNGGYQTRRGNYFRRSTLTGQTEKSWLVKCATECEGIMFTSNGYCYMYEGTSTKAECQGEWYATGDGDANKHAFSFARDHPTDSTSYFIGACEGIGENLEEDSQ